MDQFSCVCPIAFQIHLFGRRSALKDRSLNEFVAGITIQSLHVCHLWYTHFKISGLVPRLSTATVEHKPKSITATVKYRHSQVSTQVRVGMAAVGDRIDR